MIKTMTRHSGQRTKSRSSRTRSRSQPRGRTPPSCNTIRAIRAVRDGRVKISRTRIDSPDDVARIIDANTVLQKKIAEMAEHLRNHEAEIERSLKDLAARK